MATNHAAMANAYQSQGLYELAIEHYRNALAIQELVMGEQLPNTAEVYNNIGAMYEIQGHQELARENYQEALAVQQIVLGELHPENAKSYHVIASVYNTQGNFKLALENYQKSLAIRQVCLGNQHADTASSYNAIGAVYEIQGHYDLALENYKKALVIQRELYDGSELYRTFARSYNNIGNVYKMQGCYAFAVEYYQKALSIQVNILGELHAETADYYVNIASIFERRGLKRVPWSERAHSTLVELSPGLNMLLTALVIGYERVVFKSLMYQDNFSQLFEQLSIACFSSEDYNSALENYQKSLEIRQVVLGEQHADTVTAYTIIQHLKVAQFLILGDFGS